MNERDPNIDEEIRQSRAILFLLSTAFFLLVVFLVFLFSTLSSCASHNKGKCPAYYSKTEKINKSNV